MNSTAQGLQPVRIAGVGMHLPKQIVSNDDLSTLLDTNDEWIYSRTGIRSRRFARPGRSTSELAFPAAIEAIRMAGLRPQDIDLILFATLSPDHHFPGSGCYLQAHLGLDGVPAMDIRNQCSGFLYGLSTARAFIQSGAYRHVLLVGAEIHSHALDLSPTGREVSSLFGDGAGAVVLSPATESDGKIHDILLFADGKYADCLTQKIWDIRQKPYIQCNGIPGCVDPEFLWAKMDGKKVFRQAVRKLTEVTQILLKKNNISIEEIDLVVPHQANRRINEMVAETLEIQSDRVVHSIEHYGNTTAASIPMALYESHRTNRLKKGMNVLSIAFGSGFTWGGALFTF